MEAIAMNELKETRAKWNATTTQAEVGSRSKSVVVPMLNHLANLLAACLISQ